MMNTPMVHAPEVIAAYGRCAEEMVRRRDEQCPMGRMSDAWDVAFAALFLASDEAKGWRRRISSKMATGRRPGALFSKGTTSLSQTAASGSCRRRPRGAFFCEGSRGSCSIR
jgi:hypothetical protein